VYFVTANQTKLSSTFQKMVNSNYLYQKTKTKTLRYRLSNLRCFAFKSRLVGQTWNYRIMKRNVIYSYISF